MKVLMVISNAKRRSKWIRRIGLLGCAIGIACYVGTRKKAEGSIGDNARGIRDERAADSSGAAGKNRLGGDRSAEKPFTKLNGAKRMSIDTFEIADFEAAWDEAIRSGKNEVDQLYNLSIVVGRMSGIGDSGVVLDKIVAQYGPGKSRCFLIGALFMGTNRIESLKTAYTRLEYPDEFAAAHSGIANNLCMVDSLGQIDHSKYSFLGDQFDEVLRKTLELYVSRFYSKPADELSSAFASALALQPTDEGKRNLLGKLSRIAPFDCWAELASHKWELPGDEQYMLLAQMFGKDATRAMEQIAATPGGEKHFPAAFELWLDKDARKPIEWLESNNHKLNLVQKESAMKGVAKYSINQGDPETAWQWVDQITDKNLHKSAEGHVWSKEREMVRQEVRRNPSAALDSLVAGGAPHKDYWIEEAITTWMARDPARAQEWYQKNKDSVPTIKSQYFAAAFAIQSANKGDEATASEWLSHIQDPGALQRTKARVAEIINAK